MGYYRAGEGVLLVATDGRHQAHLQRRLVESGVVRIHLITKDTPITLTPMDPRTLDVVITTKQHVEGYTLTQFRTMVMPLLLSNQATRGQLDGRLNRISQTSPFCSLHHGALWYPELYYEAI